MNGLTSIDDQILTLVIVDCEMGSKVLIEARKVGVTGGTIFLGRGTIKNPLLNLFGIDESRKEIVMMITPYNLEDKLHEQLNKKFHMHKPDHGIILTLLVNSVYGLHSLPKKEQSTGGNTMNYEVVFTIVERGLGQEVVDVATSAGSKGATIINARGSGVHEHSTFFAMNIEPEKEIVMMILEKDKVQDIIKSIEDTLHIDDPGKGILFTMDVNRVTGLFQDRK